MTLNINELVNTCTVIYIQYQIPYCTVLAGETATYEVNKKENQFYLQSSCITWVYILQPYDDLYTSTKMYKVYQMLQKMSKFTLLQRTN